MVDSLNAEIRELTHLQNYNFLDPNSIFCLYFTRSRQHMFITNLTCSVGYFYFISFKLNPRIPMFRHLVFMNTQIREQNLQISAFSYFRGLPIGEAQLLQVNAFTCFKFNLSIWTYFAIGPTRERLAC